MADLLSFLPSLSSLFGGSATPNGGFVAPLPPRPPVPPGTIDETPTNPFPGVPEHLTLAGLPVAPLVAGGLIGLANSAFASKRNRAPAFGRGFLLGNQMFSRPIEEEKARAQRMQEIAMQQGWLTPFGIDAGGVPAPPVMGDITTATGDVPLVSAPGTFGPGGSGPAGPLPPASSRPTPTTTIGGMRFRLAPTTTYGKLLPGVNLPPEIRDANTPITEGNVKLGVAGAEKQDLRQTLINLGQDPKLTTEMMLRNYDFEQGQQRSKAAREGLPPLTDYGSEQVSIGPGGAITTTRIEKPSAEIDAAIRAEKDRAANAAAQLEYLRNEKGKASQTPEYLRTLSIQLDKQVDDMTKALTTHMNPVGGGVIPGHEVAAQNIQRDIKNLQAQQRDVADRLNTLGGVPSNAAATATANPAQQAHDDQLRNLYNATVAGIDKQKTFASFEEMVPNIAGQEETRKEVIDTLKAQYEPVFKALDEATGGKQPWGIGPLRTSKLAMIPIARANQLRAYFTPNVYDRAVRMWALRKE